MPGYVYVCIRYRIIHARLFDRVVCGNRANSITLPPVRMMRTLDVPLFVVLGAGHVISDRTLTLFA